MITFANPLGKYVIIGGVVAGLLAVGGAYLKGRTDGTAIAAAESRRQVIEQLTERSRINESVSNLSAADLCDRLGGVFKNGQCE